MCLPTKLAFAETTRLARDLAQNTRGGGIKLKTVVVNRVVDEATFGDQQVQRLATRQRLLLDRYLKKELRGTLCTEAPLATSGQELVGVFGLRFFGGPLFSDWTDLFAPSKSSKLIVCGGKGGVGKTTVAASLAVAFADQGLSTAIVSTDPAHSLGDALDLTLGKELVGGGHVRFIGETRSAGGRRGFYSKRRRLRISVESGREITAVWC